MYWHNLWEIFWIVFALEGSIFVHEFGHYWAAKRCGLWVPCFSVGFGPKLFSWRANGTRFQVALIPLGGYVTLPQMGDMEAIEGVWNPPPGTAERVPTFLGKIEILAAGAGCNLLFALFIACVLWLVGIPTPKSDRTTTIGAIPQTIAYSTDTVPNPLTTSELRVGDRILSVDGIALQQFSQLPQLIAMGTRHMDDGQPAADLQICRENGVFRLTIPVFPPLKKENRPRHVAVFPASDLLVGTVLENSPAQRVGLLSGDQILAVGGRELLSPMALDEYLQGVDGGTDLTICRDGKILQIDIRPQPLTIQKAHMRGVRKGHTVIFVEGEKSQWLALNGPKGIKNRQFSPDELLVNFTSLEHIPPVTHRVLGIIFAHPQIVERPNPFKLLLSDMRAVWRMLCSLFNRHSDVGAQNLTGIFGMGRLLHHFIQSDLRLALAFIVNLNVGLAVLNLLPIPGLDGGLIFFTFVEKAIRQPLPKWFANFARSLCIFLLSLLLIYVCIFDILRWRRAASQSCLDALYPSPKFENY
ncbi:MAG: site-2 protease family protein [Puniceicoccales bacterium]|jgi:regulator of sigma E protease|nr:site-2 protease family protein [Puniceicoccales bacterium]